ncbi:MAG: hypothetical protein PHE68_00950 [Candidatus Peribacteraceae bacterium]|nr:hypothetical protein [Candidatus Peribacteraceae bacterium]MDD5074911.1 hypothetical protein [Candidatus Peribacteraceae bacterium]
MNDELQHALAEEMAANTEHKREETKVYKRKNWLWGWGTRLLGFFIIAGLLAIGFVAGYGVRSLMIQ